MGIGMTKKLLNKNQREQESFWNSIRKEGLENSQNISKTRVTRKFKWITEQVLQRESIAMINKKKEAVESYDCIS